MVDPGHAPEPTEVIGGLPRPREIAPLPGEITSPPDPLAHPGEITSPPNPLRPAPWTPVPVALGDHAAVLTLRRPVAPDVLAEGLGRLAFAPVLHDEQTGARVFGECSLQLGGDDPQTATPDRPARIALVGTVHRPFLPRHTPSLRWESLRPCGFAVFGNMNLDALDAAPFVPIARGVRYEMRFFTRMRTATKAAAVLDLLAGMGWDAVALVALKRDMRLPGRPGASMTQWYAEATWARASSCLTERDPIFVEDICALSIP